MSSASPAILWFREDLRLTDNPALNAAVNSGRPLICVYLRETGAGAPREMGGASRWWLNKSLASLGASLEAIGGKLTLRTGPAEKIIPALVEETGAAAVFWNRRYGLPERETDAAIKKTLKDNGVECQSFNGRLLMEPWDLKTGSGGWYKVFTPFWRALQAQYKPPAFIPSPKKIAGASAETENLKDWGLHPEKPDWSGGIAAAWEPGEVGAQKRLDAFLDGPVSDYVGTRNLPGVSTGTSRLSPHLRFGEIGPAQIWRAVRARLEAQQADEDSARVFLSEIAWREFSYTLLYYNPALATENYNSNFNQMAWRKDDSGFAAWSRGQTGYPIVDAGMRELWHTGWMHNRVRMIVASFLTKHLLLPWQQGEQWFWDTLVDADPAANPASWQWTAGSGADAAPYFRVFNPISQGQKFDEDGAYVRHWCPELAGLPDKYLHAPFEADAQTLKRARVMLGTDYPEPIIDHPVGRQRALDAYKAMKEEQTAE
ncbi:deoxyribodipyrimidine photolyase family protein [Hyphomonas neptunium ATCC 15444]|uniref:Deoxyribodipyrimidine photo-lyase n=2 Tax=Hyphomonas TaxID=85 RepID=Q0C191_HYPNA|nr:MULTISPECIES: deoxyribodipyrimidine photo-lyase [Hyphomonas]ABI75705.1 deoxyribodipyrimidine photolyase family protein [Hyphomonas neptunium ATCC 15444]KCZ95085.1 deoxyribodipyrimidine photolyase family protein [Hyphomonas hirschiana VP5]